jgi:hypothetical protein
VLGSISGRGKSSVSIDAPTLFGTDTISVEAVSADAFVSGEASVAISDKAPDLVLYEDHPLFGIMFHTAIGPNAFIPESEMSFTAIPYFAPAHSAADPSLDYAWRVNGSPLSGAAGTPNEITINAAGSGGPARIQLSLSHATNYFFGADGAWGVTFTRGASGGSGANDPFGTR